MTALQEEYTQYFQKRYEDRLDDKTLANIPDTSEERKNKLIEITKFVLYINKKSIAKYIQAFEDTISLLEEVKQQSFTDQSIIDKRIQETKKEKDELLSFEQEKIDELHSWLDFINNKEEISSRDYKYYVDDAIYENISIFELNHEGNKQFICGEFTEKKE